MKTLKALIALLFIIAHSVYGQTPMSFDLDSKYEEWIQKDSSELWKSFHTYSNSDFRESVVSINNGQCSGSLVSVSGLVLSNYHCFFDDFSLLSSELIQNGFLAKSKKQEIKLEGVEIEITDTIYEITNALRFNSKDSLLDSYSIDNKIDAFLKQWPQNASFRYVVKKFEPGNRYFLIKYNIYKDISLVCIPPLNVANFGGQGTNWSWPRYSADFCIIRILDLKKDNSSSLQLSSEFPQENQLVYSAGYPASTNRNGSSYSIDFKVNFENEIRNSIRKKRLFIMDEELSYRPELKKKYYSQYQDISNYNLFIEGESLLFRKKNYLEQRQNLEQELAINNKLLHQNLDSLDFHYRKLKLYSVPRLYLNEALVSPQIFLFTFKFNALFQLLKNKAEPIKIKETVDNLREFASNYFLTYDQEIDKKIFVKMMETYDLSVSDSLKPDFHFKIKQDYKNDLYLYTLDIFQQSIFSSKNKVLKFLESPTLVLLENDPAFEHSSAYIEHYFTKIAPNVSLHTKAINNLNLVYSKYFDEYKSEANETLRISSGEIKGYSPEESLNYDFKTSFGGWYKTLSQYPDSDLNPSFLQILKNNDSIPLCFIANLDVTAGNSGSPVLNKWGAAIGLVFDQNYEGMANQFVYDPQIQRATCLSSHAIITILKDYFDSKKLLKELNLN